MPKRKFSGRYAPLVYAGVRCAYRTMRGNARGAFLVRRRRPRRTSRLQRRSRTSTRTRVRLHQPVRQSGTGGSFSSFYYGRRRGPMTSAFKANATNYFSINGASPINIGVGVQTVTTVRLFRVNH